MRCKYECTVEGTFRYNRRAKNDRLFHNSRQAVGVWRIFFASPVAVTGEIENRAGVVTLRFKTVFTMDHTCDRCLKEFSREYVYDFEHTLVRSVQSDRDDYVVCENNTLDLDELAISDLLLQLPTKILCRDDCKGLCYVCGQDLNEGKCNCS